MAERVADINACWSGIKEPWARTATIGRGTSLALWKGQIDRAYATTGNQFSLDISPLSIGGKLAKQAEQSYGVPVGKILVPGDQSQPPSTRQEIRMAKIMAEERGDQIGYAVLSFFHWMGTARGVYQHEGLRVKFIPAEILVATSDPNPAFRYAAIRLILGSLGMRQAFYEGGKRAIRSIPGRNLDKIYDKVPSIRSAGDNNMLSSKWYIEGLIRHDAPIEKTALRRVNFNNLRLKF